ncbi:fibronectin type III domain-containing protein [Altericroceibacterium endophyticum]|uniref:Metallophosphatase n=1 Tax=Altericroceibacterium endophyticum TaxID=1808508 RepID=A0A6I4T2X6_9SPHN|nr:fibronectin type III domain-containing protein [Altericroceibacterium endophyticum]MXO65216.1 metallophosphatase [Altericroceibacterium endophyticum]
MKIVSFLVGALALAVPVCSPLAAQEAIHPSWQPASHWPDRIVATLPGDPQTSFAVTWRTDLDVTESVAQITLAQDGPELEEHAETLRGSVETLDLEQVEINGETFDAHWNKGLGAVNYHSVEFNGLSPDTLYAYRVKGGDEEWSEWFQLRTAPEDGPVTFLYLGDAQNDILSRWSRVIREAFATASDARFIVHAGDLTNKSARDRDWGEWFKALSFIHSRIPAIPATGNHEYMKLETDGRVSDRDITMLWRPQFSLPVEESLPRELAELAYDVRYTKDVHVFIITSTDDDHLQAQADWLDREMSRSDAKWKIVSFHHPIFSSSEGRDTPEKRDILLPVFLKHKVDLVLQGHDHTYARGAIGSPSDKLGFADSGALIETMFVNSVGGPKQYDWKTTGWDEYADAGVKLARSAADTQLFQVLRVDGDRLTYESRTATGALYDDFVLDKQQDGRKLIVSAGTSTMPERMSD